MRKDNPIGVDSEAKAQNWSEILDRMNKKAKEANERTRLEAKTRKNVLFNDKSSNSRAKEVEMPYHGSIMRYMSTNTAPDPNHAFKDKKKKDASKKRRMELSAIIADVVEDDDGEDSMWTYWND
jgi:hypothetical protein